LKAVMIAVGLADKLNNSSFVGQSVQKGSGQGRIGKNRIPVTKAQIAGDDHRDFFIQVADELKKELPTYLIDRNETQLIEDEQIQLDKVGYKAR
jgi:hypothetical protein